MQTAPERQKHAEAERLRKAIRRHRSKVRPSSRRAEDFELYRALGPEEERPTVHVVPPSSYTELAERYYDSPY